MSDSSEEPQTESPEAKPTSFIQDFWIELNNTSWKRATLFLGGFIFWSSTNALSLDLPWAISSGALVTVLFIVLITAISAKEKKNES